MEAAGKRYIEHASRTDEFRIWNLSDLHLLNKACAVADIKRDVEKIRNDPFSFWLGGGDYAEFIGYRDKRFDPDSVPEWVPVKQLGRLGQFGMEQVRDIFLPIQDKCLGLLLGNHELRYERMTDQEGLHGWLCAELGVKSLEYCALFDVVFVRRAAAKKPKLRGSAVPKGSNTSTTFRIFAHHGAGYATTPGGKLNRLVQFMQSFDADIYFCGHVHDQVARQEPAIGANDSCTKLTQRIRLGLVSGSYLKTYGRGTCSYGEQRGYRPTNLGAAVAYVKPDTREVKALV